MLQNRNAALYVDFNSEEMEFKAPSEMVDSNYLIGNPGFSEHILNYTNYDKAIEFINAVILEELSKKTWFVKSVGREIERKTQDVLAKVDAYKEQFGVKHDTFEQKVETVFSARLRSDKKLGLLYCCIVGTKDNSVFLMDENTNHFEIRPNGRVIHSRFARTIEETPGVFRNEWEVIGSR